MFLSHRTHRTWQSSLLVLCCLELLVSLSIWPLVLGVYLTQRLQAPPLCSTPELETCPPPLPHGWSTPSLLSGVLASQCAASWAWQSLSMSYLPLATCSRPTGHWGVSATLILALGKTECGLCPLLTCFVTIISCSWPEWRHVGCGDSLRALGSFPSVPGEAQNKFHFSSVLLELVWDSVSYLVT